MSVPIEDYAMIGDGQTAALVSRDGSIDWLCWPRFDSAACFAALLGNDTHGRWRIGPTATDARATRRYLEDTLVLETTFETPAGAVSVTDFMPPRNGWSEVIRIVRGVRGRVDLEMDLVLRFDYGQAVPWVSRLPDDTGLRAIAGPDMAVLRTPVELRGARMRTVASFTVEAGQMVPFVLAYAPSHTEPRPATDALAQLDKTRTYWLDWSNRCSTHGEFQAAVRRSLITLKALAYEPTGGIVAAATTSLPEALGGMRNWDYRYCWLRDASITLHALMRAGYYEEAQAWRGWLERAIAGSPSQLQIMYGLAGERRLNEWELPWLPGYEDSRPVRVGNNAVAQVQLDIYGEVMSALHVARAGGITGDETTWAVQHAMIEHLGEIWQMPDEGIWETRGGRQQFTFSKIMAWVAVDRALRGIEQLGLEGPVERWRTLRDRIHADVCAQGWNSRRNAFTQTYGGDALDASLLLLPLLGFLPPEDPRVIGTLHAIERDLTVDGLVLRYRTDESADGLPPGEGTFLACSFWLVDNLILQGRTTEARELFTRMLSLCNDVGLLAEEYDPRTRRQLGNFPQAFSHVALVHAALNLHECRETFVRDSGPPSNRGGASGDASGRTTRPDTPDDGQQKVA
jgi:GH15 family glucan-1,4-alpha-glucosidase